jgi:hypothetical protein
MNEQQDRDHWAALARDLGLESEPETQTELPLPPAQALEEKVEEEEVSFSGVPEESTSPEADAPISHETDFPPESVEETASEPKVAAVESEPESVPPPEETEGTTEAEVEETRSASQRRRRRSGRSSAKAETENPPEEEVSSEAEPTEETAGAPGSGRGRRRGRGRTRKKGTGEAAASELDTEDAHKTSEEPGPLASEEPDDEDLTSLNMPSWQELIASLYRP